MTLSGPFTCSWDMCQPCIHVPLPLVLRMHAMYLGRRRQHWAHNLGNSAPPPLPSFLIARLSLRFSTIYCDFKWIDYSIIPLWFSMYILARFGSPGDNCPFHKMVKAATWLLHGILLVAVVWGLPHEYFTMSLLGLFGPLVARNLQILMAFARIILSWEWLFMDPTDVHNSGNFNMKIGVKLLYIMEMFQGILFLWRAYWSHYPSCFGDHWPFVVDL